jgi:hypothetical protein
MATVPIKTIYRSKCTFCERAHTISTPFKIGWHSFSVFSRGLGYKLDANPSCLLHTHTHTYKIVVTPVTEALVDYLVGEATSLIAKCLLKISPNKWSSGMLCRVGRRRQHATPKRPHRLILNSARTQSIIRGTTREALKWINMCISVCPQKNTSWVRLG